MKDDYVVVGLIGSTYGIKGYLKVFSYTQEKTDLLKYKPWYLEAKDNTWIPIEVENGREHGKLLVAKLKDYESPEEARVLTGKKVAILRSKLPDLKPNEYYWRDLEGLTVVNQEDQTLGTVAYFITTGANDVMVIKKDNKEHAIPYIKDVILKVDLKNRVINVNWELI